MRSVWATQRGSSLVELLTSTLFVSTLMLMAYGFARAALMNARLQEAGKIAPPAPNPRGDGKAVIEQRLKEQQAK